MAPPLALAVPSLIALVLLAADRRRAEPRRWRRFLIAVMVYGVVRSLAVRWVTETALQGSAPYGFGGGGPALFGVPLQELAGWMVAVSLAWAVGEGLTGALGRAATPHRVALGAAVVLAALSFAVETAAIAAGWWQWTLDLPPADGWRLVPWIAVVDWSFVAFDFLLPFLLWTAPSSAAQRWAASALLPLHMVAHLLVAPLPPPLLLGGFDWMHAAILGYVAAMAWNEGGRAGAAPETVPGRRLGALAAMGAAAVVAGVLLGLAGAGPDDLNTLSRRWTALLPAVALVAVAAWPRRERAPAPGRPAIAGRIAGRVPMVRFVVALVPLLVTYGLRAEPARRQQQYRDALELGVRRWSAGDVRGAEAALRHAVAAHDEAADGHWLLGLTLLAQGRRSEARQQLERAHAVAPARIEPAALLAALDLRSGDRAAALRRVDALRREHPDSAEATYLGAVAAGRSFDAVAGDAIALAVAEGGEAPARLGRVAALLGDAETLRRCNAAAAASRGS